MYLCVYTLEEMGLKDSQGLSLKLTSDHMLPHYSKGLKRNLIGKIKQNHVEPSSDHLPRNPTSKQVKKVDKKATQAQTPM